MRTCSLIVVCDGWRSGTYDKCHPHQGRHSLERLEAYAQRIDALQDAITSVAAAGAGAGGGVKGSSSWAKSHWEILRLQGWHGYGQALLCVETLLFAVSCNHSWFVLCSLCGRSSHGGS